MKRSGETIGCEKLKGASASGYKKYLKDRMEKEMEKELQLQTLTTDATLYLIKQFTNQGFMDKASYLFIQALARHCR